MRATLGEKQKLKEVQSKKSAFKLLIGLLKRDHGLIEFFINQSMKTLMESVEPVSGFNYTPPAMSERF